MMNREDLRDAMGALALGILPAAEAREVCNAIRDDNELRAEFHELREAADAVAMSAEATFEEFDELAASRLRHKLLAAIRTPAAVETTVAPDVPRRAPRYGWVPWGAAAAAIVVAIGSYASNASLQLQVAADHAALDRERAETTARLNTDHDQIALATQERRNVEAILSEHARHYGIPHGDVISTQGRLYLALRRLRALPPGKVYQAWTIAAGHAPIPGATFVPQGDVTIVALGAPAHGVGAVALTVEPKGGSKKPTSTPTFVRRLV